MADFPDSIYEPRTVANDAGTVYNPAETTRLFAEDVNKANQEIVAVEQFLKTQQFILPVSWPAGPITGGTVAGSNFNSNTGSAVLQLAHGAASAPVSARFRKFSSMQEETPECIWQVATSRLAMPATGSAFMGIAFDYGEDGPDQNALMFRFAQNQVLAFSADGDGQESTDVTSQISTPFSNNLLQHYWAIHYRRGEFVRFYVDGLPVAEHTTRVPDLLGFEGPILTVDFERSGNSGFMYLFINQVGIWIKPGVS